MSVKEHRLFIYKANSEIIEATNSCLSFSFDAGSVVETGDLYADNPSKTLGIKLLNTNDKQYSPHYTKGKIKFVDTTMNLVSGTNIYNLPYETTLMIYDKSNKYNMLISQDKVRVNNYNGIETETINVRIAYLDTTTNNELNYIDGNFAPLLQERARVTLYEDTVDYSIKTLVSNGNGTNSITFNYNSTLYEVINLKCGIPKTFFDFGSDNFYEMGQENFYELSTQIKTYMNLNVVSFTQVGNLITITFDKVLSSDTIIVLSLTFKSFTEFLKFDGYINGAIESDLESVSFNCVDRAYDLMSYKVSSTSFRGYDSIATSDNEYETVEESIQITLTSNSCTTTYLNYLNLFALNDVVKIYNGQDYYECTISAITNKSMTLTSSKTIKDGTYTVYKVYNPSLALETFIQNCLNDVGLPYTLYLGTNLYEFAYLPKNDEMQYNDLWNFLQDILIKTGNILSFENINNNFELFYRMIPTTFGTSKYTISDRHILQGTTFSMTGENVRNSYYLKYSNYESGSYVDTELIVDDFTLSSYQGTILTERNILSTDEILAVNDIIRINSEYLEVRQVISSGIYKLNKNASESGTFDLYLSGDSTNEYGLKRAYYELDSTSQIDTNAEATNFLNLVLAQTKYPISTYVVKLNGNDYDLYNFDTITVNSPRLSLFNETMFVQSVAYDNNGGQKTLTITLTKIMQTGKYKYKEMITERGLNSVVTTNKNTTNDVFPPPQKLVALDPAIDDLQDYNVYSYVSWNDFIGRTVAQWEIQYSTSENFDTYETITQNTTSLKLFLKEQKKYYIRVRGVGKEQVKGQWATTTVDLSEYLVLNPITNRTWYVDLEKFDNNIVDYLNAFDKLGITKDSLNAGIDVVSVNIKNNSQEISLSSLTINTTERFADSTFGSVISFPKERYKKFKIKGSRNGELSLDIGSLPLSGSFFITIPPIISLEGEIDITKLTSKYKSYDYIQSGYLKHFEGYNFWQTPTYETNILKNLIIELEAPTTPPTQNLETSIITGNTTVVCENLKIISNYTGVFNKLKGISGAVAIKNCEINNFFYGTVTSYNLTNNSVNVISGGTKYSGSYSPSGTSASNTAEGGFNS